MSSARDLIIAVTLATFVFGLMTFSLGILITGAVLLTITIIWEI